MGEETRHGRFAEEEEPLRHIWDFMTGEEAVPKVKKKPMCDLDTKGTNPTLGLQLLWRVTPPVHTTALPLNFASRSQRGSGAHHLPAQPGDTGEVSPSSNSPQALVLQNHAGRHDSSLSRKKPNHLA